MSKAIQFVCPVITVVVIMTDGLVMMVVMTMMGWVMMMIDRGGDDGDRGGDYVGDDHDRGGGHGSADDDRGGGGGSDDDDGVGDGRGGGGDDVVFVSGLAPGGNPSGLDLGPGVGGGQQSRFKWMMEGHSPSSSSPEAVATAALHKNGTTAGQDRTCQLPSVSPSEGPLAMNHGPSFAESISALIYFETPSAASSFLSFVLIRSPQGPLPNPMKTRGESPYSHYDLLGSEGLGLPPQGPMDHWHRSPGTKMPPKAGPSSWPPGEPPHPAGSPVVPLPVTS